MVNTGLKVNLHNMTNPRNNHYVQQLCKILNESETIFPGTNLRLIYEMVSNPNPAGQEFCRAKRSPGEGEDEESETSRRNPVGGQSHLVMVSHQPETSLA